MEDWSYSLLGDGNYGIDGSVENYGKVSAEPLFTDKGGANWAILSPPTSNLSLRHSQRQHAYAQAACRFHGVHTGVDGGACGHDVVDDEDVFASDGFSIDQCECVLHIL